MVIRNPGDDFPFDDPAPETIDPWQAAGDPPEPAGRDARDPVEDEEDDDEEWDRGREGRRDRRRRHERVLHTRISEQLSDDIRRAADDLRVPVSNLVRNVLEEAFGAVERVSDEVGDFLEEMLGDADGARRDLRRLRRRVQHMARRQRRRFAGREPLEDEPEFAERGADAAEAGRTETPRAFPDVLGWQSLRLNAAAPCAGCDRPLETGERVLVGATERGLSRTFLCERCARTRNLA